MANTKSNECNGLTSTSISFPPFNEGNIKNWFIQLEAIFQVRKITAQKQKFCYLVPALPPAIVDEVSDLLEAIPDEDPYSHLKEAILK